MRSMSKLVAAAFAALAAMVAAPGAGRAQSTPIAIEDFAALPGISAPTLSPDGRRVLALVNVEGRERLAVIDMTAPEGTRPRMIDSENDIGWYRWAGNNLILVGISREAQIFGVDVVVTRVATFDLATGRTRLIDDRDGFGMFADDVIFVDPDGRFLLISAQPDILSEPNVYRVDLAAGNRLRIVERSRPGIWSWFADESGVVRAGVQYGERRMRFFYRRRGEDELRRVETRPYTREDSVVDVIHFVGDSDRSVLVTNSETGRFAVYEYDFATDTRGAALFEHPEVDVTRPIFGPGQRLDGVSYEDDRPRIRWLNPEMETLQRAIDRTFRDKTNLILDRSRDGNRILVWTGGADDPGAFYVYDRAARRMDGIAAPYEQLRGRPLAPVRAISYRSRDGLAINGYLTLPPGRGESGLPLVVLPHGGPFARDSWVFDAEVQFLASRGYAVLQPNFRGSTGYGREFVERGYGQYGGGMIDDMEDGIDWLVGQGTVDASRVCIMGSSYGGYAAIWSAIRSPQRYRCAISMAGPTDLKSMRRYTSGFVPRRYVRAFRDQLQGEDRIDLDTISPLRHAERLTVPLLIGHGENDIVVPPAQSRRLVDALARRRIGVESVFYPRAAHGFTTEEERTDWFRRIETFLTRHNPAEASAS